jgi:YYY domain-containing protein
MENKTEKHSWLYDLLFIFVLLLAGVLRFSGSDWGEGYHQHPDELFLSGVLGALDAQACDLESVPIAICPEDQQRWLTPFEYFDTAKSPLNPYNRGYSFFVYGNLPMTLLRVSSEAFGMDDLGTQKLFARQMSALVDLLTIFVLYLIVSNLYGRRVALFASAFSALTVMQIQQSHFFTTDLYANLFMFLAIYFAVEIVNAEKGEGRREKREENGEKGEENGKDSHSLLATRYSSTHLLSIHLFSNRLLWLSIAFGFALGMAMASKINAAALALMLPAAFVLRYFIHDRPRQSPVANDQSPDYWSLITVFLIAGGLATLLSFRIFQPYAFDGLGLNSQWISNILEQRAQAAGSDLPWNLQWARRSHLYSFENLTTWGLGLPLGILAWAGFLLMGWRIVKGEWRHLLLWGWTAFYFLWQSFQFNPTMRYQLPVYPLLAMMAAWAIFEIQNSEFRIQNFKARNVLRFLFYAFVALVSSAVLISTAIWAFAFQSIYLRDEPRIAASRWIFQNVPGPVNVQIEATDGELYNQPLPVSAGTLIPPRSPYSLTFVPRFSGTLSQVVFGHARDATSPATIVVSLYSSLAPDVALAHSTAVVDFKSADDPRGPSVTFLFDQPIQVFENQLYYLRIETLGSGLALSGASIANESNYDWGLPFRIDGYDAYGGIYPGDLTLQVYWDDNPDKLNRFVQILSQSDTIVIPTNHQYAQITRIPERYPLTTYYYRELLGCPIGADIIECYETAEPGDYEGRLGFELAQVFTSYPTFGNLVINDQSAEEAFTFYDHPKVMIFKKTADFDVGRLAASLATVDLTNVVRLLPKDAANYKDLLLPAAKVVSQRAGGTWSELFDYDWIHNKYPALGVVVWYLFIFLLGLVAYPITRSAFSGLSQYAYPLSRMVGILLLAWISWMGGSIGVPYTRISIGVAFALIGLAGFGLWFVRRDQFKAEWNSSRRFFVTVEIVFLVFFLIDLLIRLGNSDMWHPARGGERPMDFSYFNAVLKSTSFPPYDPWFAGGYINYYYYGFVLAGTPVKLLGIVPSIAYNFILPTWFAMIAIGAFGIGYSLVKEDSLNVERSTACPEPVEGFNLPFVTGLTASTFAILLGNQGTIQTLFRALQKMAAPMGNIPSDATFVQKWGWAFQGFLKLFDGATLPIGRGEWYWNPSRVIPTGPGNEITEFPLFTLLYSDLHAHMLVMPLTLLIIAWAIAFIKSHAKMSRVEWIAAFAVGGLMIGALKPTNTWDLYTFFPFSALAAMYAINRHFEWNGRFKLPDWLGRALFSLAFVVGLYLLGRLMYAPFDRWFGLAYNSVQPWTSSRTPLSSYFTHWGLFLFIIAFWLFWELREWMAATPVSHLKRLAPYAIGIELALAAVLALFVFFLLDGVWVALIALPLAFLAGLLLLRPDMPGVKRGVLLMIGTGLALTLAVEVITLRGDIGRMNTIFKLYMQVWMLFAVSAAAAFGWLLDEFPFWRARWRTIYQTGLYILLAGAFMFTVTATTDKISDRLNNDAPHTLDGMTFMNHSQHFDRQIMDLSQDYRAIRWMQDNVEGSPVIVEANCSEYRWCTRFTIYTGLPGVVGWNWHQRQQRASTSTNVIFNRVSEIGMFYTTPDIASALAFLDKYQVKYIVVGQLERNVYPPINPTADGLAKFEKYEGKYWKAVYHDGDTTIYEVMP